MKKFINVLAVLLALVMCLGIVVACADDETNKGSEGSTTPAATTTTPTVTTTTAQQTTTAKQTTTDLDDTYNPVPSGTVPADGTIKDANDLHAVLVNGESDKNYTVTATEIDMAGLSWVGLKDYTGTFDFGGCVVKNASFPMFTSVTGGTVKNLVLADSKQDYTNQESVDDKDLVPISDSDTQCRVYGGVVRYMADGVISNVTVESDVEINANIWIGDSYIGGVVGYAKGTNIRIENCTFKGTLYTDSLKIFIGGIAGYVDSSDTGALNQDDPSLSTVIVTDCVNYGTVTDAATGNDSKVAGIAGAMGSGAVYRCANYGAISSADKGQVAGIVGWAIGDITYMYCVNDATILGGTGYVGGVVGYSNGAVRNFIGCINLGRVGLVESGNSTSIGGVMGYLKKNENFSHCYNLSTICESWGVGGSGVVNPLDSATHTTSTGTPTIADCANLESIDAILAAIGEAHPGVFVKDGETIKFA